MDDCTDISIERKRGREGGNGGHQESADQRLDLSRLKLPPLESSYTVLNHTATKVSNINKEGGEAQRRHKNGDEERENDRETHGDRTKESRQQ